TSPMRATSSKDDRHAWASRPPFCTRLRAGETPAVPSRRTLVMQPFTTLEAAACPLPIANVDTDQIIPARFLKRLRSQGYADVLLHDLRFGADGQGRSSLSLDDPRHEGAKIIVARRNFGCGSSRESAVYALADFGIACVIAPSFGDIFAKNCVMNGVLPVRLSEAEIEALLASPQV